MLNNADSNQRKLLEFVLPPKMKIVYEVFCNKDYIKVIGKLDDSFNSQGLSVKTKSNEFIISLKDKIAYDISNNTYYVVVENTIAKSNVKFLNKKPYYITPFLIFVEPPGTLAFFENAKMKLKLVKYKKIKHKMDFQSIFSEVKNRENLSKINFIE
ncbi:MAG: hypothetical protein NZ516_02720 [Raineya sp.]|nr:hypothetical protein [Raineya sp.]